MDRFLFAKGQFVNSTSSHLGLLFLRLFAGLTLAFAHGVDKVPPNEQFVGFLDVMGFPMAIAFAWLAGLAEFLGGLLVAMGLLSRPASLSVMVTMLVAAFMAHANDPFQKKEMALLYFFVFLLIFLMGPGKFSLDNKIRK
ncbi:MAG: DoxX family protein [Bdellovibrionaceae bacterium]|nr:DoxX family protein [Pseudobdellovibrionaceae bacterium]